MTEGRTTGLDVRQLRPQGRPCSRCAKRSTRSVTGLCWACRPVPEVCRDIDETILVSGLGRFTEWQALTLAQRIADAIDSRPSEGQNR